MPAPLAYPSPDRASHPQQQHLNSSAGPVAGGQARGRNLNNSLPRSERSESGSRSRSQVAPRDASVGGSHANSHDKKASSKGKSFFRSVSFNTKRRARCTGSDSQRGDTGRLEQDAGPFQRRSCFLRCSSMPLLTFCVKSFFAVIAKDLSHVPCKFHKAGNCTAGTACPFSHDLTVPGTTKPVCQWYAKGNCKFGHKVRLAVHQVRVERRD